MRDLTNSSELEQRWSGESLVCARDLSIPWIQCARATLGIRLPDGQNAEGPVSSAGTGHLTAHTALPFSNRTPFFRSLQAQACRLG